MIVYQIGRNCKRKNECEFAPTSVLALKAKAENQLKPGRCPTCGTAAETVAGLPFRSSRHPFRARNIALRVNQGVQRCLREYQHGRSTQVYEELPDVIQVGDFGPGLARRALTPSGGRC